MDAGLKLSLPLLRVTMRWQTWLIMLMAVAFALVTDSNDIGLGASGGAAAMLVISAALGLTLKRCRSRGLAHILPSFTRTALFAITAALGVLALILGALDGLRPESLLAITVAASLGMGMGLGLPASWLQWAYLGAICWVSWGRNDLATLWTSAWSPALAAFLLLIAWPSYKKIKRGDRSAVLDWERTNRISAAGKGTQPYRPGYLLSHWSSVLSLAFGCIVGAALAVTLLGDEVFAEIGPEWQFMVTGYLALLASAGVFSMLGELQSSGLQSLRRLAVLPRRGRERLFDHAELSCWRVGFCLLLTLAVALLATSIWAGNPMWLVWLTSLVTLGIVILLGTYVGLWIACMPGQGARIFTLIITFFPLQMIAAGIIFNAEHLADGRSAWASPVALATSLGLAWWLRRQARSAWASISFSRAS